MPYAWCRDYNGKTHQLGGETIRDQTPAVNTCNYTSQKPIIAKKKLQPNKPLRQIFMDKIKQVTIHDLGPINIKCSFYGILHQVDKRLIVCYSFKSYKKYLLMFLQDFSASNPKFGSCYLQKDVDFPLYPDPFLLFLRLLYFDDLQDNNFRSSLHWYNNIFVFTSVKFTTITHDVVKNGPINL